MIKIINTGLGNYYGNLIAIKNEDEKCFLELEDYSNTQRVEISKKLFRLMEKEFG